MGFSRIRRNEWRRGWSRRPRRDHHRRVLAVRNAAPLTTSVAGPQPFAGPQGMPLPSKPIPHLGGYLIPIAGPINANTPTPINHPLRAIPRSITVYDSGTNAQPLLTISARSATSFTFACSSAISNGQTLTLLVQ